MTAAIAHPLLPHAAPGSPGMRLVLYGFRRMAAGGIGDAYAAHAFFTRFGLHYRRPLVLLRALVSEIARTSDSRLTVAPCCCPRMSADERAIVDVLGIVDADPREAEAILGRLLGVADCTGAFETARAVAAAFADLGQPLDEPIA